MRNVSSLLAASNIGPRDTVYEIGAGRGIITAELASIANKVIAIEKDPVLVYHLRRRFCDCSSIEIVAGDFLGYRIRERPYKVVGNIPYNRTADIMRKILYESPVPDEAYLVMQQEAAEKFAGTRRETQFSILAKPWFQIQIVRKLGWRDFVPAPKVESVWLEIRKRPFPLIKARDVALYRKFVCFGFQGWKKNLKTTFRDVFTYIQWKRLSKKHRFPIDVKPSELSFEQWLELFACFKQFVPKVKQQMVSGA